MLVRPIGHNRHRINLPFTQCLISAPRGSTYDHTDAVDKLIKILIQEQGIEITLNTIDRICDKAKPYVEIGPASYEAFSWVDAFLHGLIRTWKH